MSTATFTGAAGALIGGYFGGPTGAQIGWTIGYGVGAYVDPEVIKSQGPRLTQGASQTARDGIPITIGYGTFPTMGNIIWRDTLVENVIVTRNSNGGKGPPTTENTTYQYTRSFAIGICRGPKAGLLLVKENGKIVYDARTDAELTAVGYGAADIQATRAASAAFLQNFTLYLGTRDQMPDPTIEAVIGMGNVSARRGLMYGVWLNKDLTDLQGAIPQFEFVVVSEGEAAPGVGDLTWLATSGAQIGGSEDGTDWEEAVTTLSSPHSLGYHLTWGNGILVKDGAAANSLSYSTDRGATWQSAVDQLVSAGETYKSLRYVGNQFWFVNASNPFDIAHSPNGSNWSVDTVAGSANAYTTIGGYADLIVACTNNGWVTYTTDGGDSWLTALALGSNAIHGIDSDGHLIVIGGENNTLAYTSDGASWNGITSPFSGGDVKRIAYSAGLGLWVAHTATEIAYSATGTAWTLATTPGSAAFNDLAAGDDLFVIVGAILDSSGAGAGTGVWTSSNGATWTFRPDLFSADSLTGIEWMPCGGLPIPDAPGWYVQEDGSICGPAGGSLSRERVVIGTIVAHQCQRSGLRPDQYDVSQLTDVIDGFDINIEAAADTICTPLLQYSFADCAECDGKVRFIKRGGDPVLFLTETRDMAEREGDAIEKKKTQEAELLRKQTIEYLDPLATYTATTQQYERRSATIKAKGENTIQIPVVTTGADMVQVAEKRVKVAWSETYNYQFSLPEKFARLTPTDIVVITDRKGVVHRIRVMGVETENGVMHIQAVRDREAAYTGTAQAYPPQFPDPVPAPVRGPTRFVAMNLPPLRADDNEQGVVVAGTGVMPGWLGYDLYLSIDGGSETLVGRFLQRARIGYLVDTIGTTSAGDTLRVFLYDGREIDSVTSAQLASGENLWALTTDGVSEVGQSQFAVFDSPDYVLDGTDRPLLGTSKFTHLAGDDFVMLDPLLPRIPIDPVYAGSTLTWRPVSIGTNPEDNPTYSMVYDPAEIVFDGNGELPEEPEGPDPDPGGAGNPGTPTARSIDPGSTTVSLTAGEANATANSAAINAAFVGNGTVITPAGTFYIDTANPIEPLSNRKLDLATNNTILRAKGSNTTTSPSVHRDIIRIDGVDNVEIEGGALIGYRDYWTANGGTGAFGVSEWAHGIYVTNGAFDVTIWDTTFEKFVGDGISIGRSAHDVHVLNIYATNNRRQGISSGGDDIHLENPECSYIGTGNGTSPRAGIDIEVDEPESNSATNVTITSPYCHHNAGPGIICYKSCNQITITDPRLEYNTKGIYAVDSDDVTVTGLSARWNKYEGLHLTGTCTNWDVEGDFYSNKTNQYGVIPDNGGDRTSTPSATQRAKHITIGSSVTGTTLDSSNTYGPV